VTGLRGGWPALGGGSTPRFPVPSYGARSGPSQARWRHWNGPFDEVIVTTFTARAQNTLPLWVFGAIRLGQQLPEVNVVVGSVLLLTVVPVVIGARLTGGRDG
jgi:hypothetical protein